MQQLLEGLKIERQPVFDTAGSVMSLLDNDTKKLPQLLESILKMIKDLQFYKTTYQIILKITLDFS